MFKALLYSFPFLFVLNTAQAAIVHPSSLSPGDPYRFVFLTSGTTTATSADISTYDQFVNNTASAADPTGLGSVNWRVIGSTPTVNAIDHLVNSADGWNPASVPIYLVNTDTLFSNNFNHLWFLGPQVPINLFENGSTAINTGSERAFTGTDRFGRGSSFMGFGSQLGSSINPQTGTRIAGLGFPFSTFNGQWIASTRFQQNIPFHLYGMSDVIYAHTSTSAVPEPSAWLLGLLALVTIPLLRKNATTNTSHSAAHMK